MTRAHVCINVASSFTITAEQEVTKENQRRVLHFYFYENLVAANLGTRLAL